MPELKTNTPLIPSARAEGNESNAAVVAAVNGEIDLKNSSDLREALFDLIQRQPAIKKLVLNLTNVPYMDSSGIAVLVEVLGKLRKSGGKVFLTNVQRRAQGILEIAKLNAIFGVVADEATALKI
jgi:anti-anti-sigma factor